LRSPRQRAARGTLTAWAGPTTREMVFIEDDGARESIQQVGLRAELSRVPGDDTPIGFLLGVEGRSEQVALTYDTDDGVTSSLGFGDNYEYGYGLVDRLGLYAEERQRLGDWELNPGIRLDYTAAGLHESLSVDPRLGLRWNLNDRAALIGGIGQYSQPPAPRELLTTWGNPDLEPERALTLTLGWRQRLSDRGDLEITAYRSQLDALIVGHEDRLELAFVLPPSMEADIGDYTNEGSGTTMGVEAMARWMSDPWEGWLGLSASRSLRTGRDGIERAFAYDQPLLSTLVVHRALQRRASLGLRLRAGAGNPYPQVTGRIWSIDAMQYLGVSEGQGRLPPVFTADLRADKAWALRRFTLTAYLDLLNATNRQNVEMLNYSEDYTEEVFVYGLPIFPAFGLRGDW
jgi:outer membrane receptor protein involved in Fe transport